MNQRVNSMIPVLGVYATASLREPEDASISKRRRCGYLHECLQRVSRRNFEHKLKRDRIAKRSRRINRQRRFET